MSWPRLVRCRLERRNQRFLALDAGVRVPMQDHHDSLQHDSHGRWNPRDVQRDAREKLLDNFDQEVIEKVRMASRNGNWFEAEMEKLDGWAEDRRASFKAELNELEAELKEAKRAARLAGTLPEKLEHQRLVRALETRRDEADRNFEQAKREVDRQKDALLDEISRRMEQQTTEEALFSFRWRLI